MRVGFAVPVSGAWAAPEHCLEVACRAEELGYSSLWVYHRLLSPVDEAGAFQLPPQYRSVLDPLGVLAFLAGRTTTARLGAAVVNAPFYAPVVLAKALATIDRLSGGRLEVGLGAGWMPEEFAAAGVPRAQRGARMEDYLGCLRAIFTEEVVDYTGPFYEVPRSRIEPKPLQRPHPPFLLGGSADAALRRAGRLADGWISSSRADLSTIDQSIGLIRAAAAGAGRDPDRLRLVCRAVVRLGSPTRGLLAGSLEELRADLVRLASTGLTDAFVDLNFDPLVGSPEADPERALRRAHEVLEGLAPGPGGTLVH